MTWSISEIILDFPDAFSNVFRTTSYSYVEEARQDV
jgi:hypothetical protein